MARKRPVKKLRPHRWCNEYREIQKQMALTVNSEDWKQLGLLVNQLEDHKRSCTVCKKHFEEERRLLYSSKTLEDYKLAEKALRECQQFARL